MNSKVIGEIAHIVLNVAEDNIVKKNVIIEDQGLCLRGSLLWAMLSVELGHGTSREVLLTTVARMYDIISQMETKCSN